MQSTKPFSETLVAILEMSGVSQRELARRTQQRDEWGSPMTVSLLLKEEIRPTIWAMEAIAGALGVSPDTFAEYRLATVRVSLDPLEVPLEKALENLERLQHPERVSGPAADEEEPEPLSPRETRGDDGGQAASS